MPPLQPQQFAGGWGFGSGLLVGALALPASPARRRCSTQWPPPAWPTRRASPWPQAVRRCMRATRCGTAHRPWAAQSIWGEWGGVGESSWMVQVQSGKPLGALEACREQFLGALLCVFFFLPGCLMRSTNRSLANEAPAHLFSVLGKAAWWRSAVCTAANRSVACLGCAGCLPVPPLRDSVFQPLFRKHGTRQAR